jgi:hypothetical protein
VAAPPSAEERRREVERRARQREEDKRREEDRRRGERERRARDEAVAAEREEQRSVAERAGRLQAALGEGGGLSSPRAEGTPPRATRQEEARPRQAATVKLDKVGMIAMYRWSPCRRCVCLSWR